MRFIALLVFISATAMAQGPSRPSGPATPALAPKQAVALDLGLAGDVTRPAAGAAPEPRFVRPSRKLPPDRQALRLAEIAFLLGVQERLCGTAPRL